MLRKYIIQLTKKTKTTKHHVIQKIWNRPGS